MTECAFDPGKSPNTEKKDSWHGICPESENRYLQLVMGFGIQLQGDKFMMRNAFGDSVVVGEIVPAINVILDEQNLECPAIIKNPTNNLLLTLPSGEELGMRVALINHHGELWLATEPTPHHPNSWLARRQANKGFQLSFFSSKLKDQLPA